MEVKAIDYMNYPFTKEWSTKVEEALKGELVCRMQAAIGQSLPKLSVDEMIKLMDEAGVEKVFLAACKMFSYWNKRMIMDTSVEEVASIIQQRPDRFVGLAGYNPFRIAESLEEIERAVKEYGFKGVYVHVYGFGIPINDRRMYPLYAKCVELDIPVSLQVGHVLEAMPSELGRPIYLDEIALHFPKLRIIGSHTGYPWCEELIAVSWKWDNVYFGVDAHMPRYLEPSVINYINTRGQDKVIWGTNGLPFRTVLQQIEELGLRESAKVKLLRENAIKVFKLDQ